MLSVKPLALLLCKEQGDSDIQLPGLANSQVVPKAPPVAIPRSKSG